MLHFISAAPTFVVRSVMSLARGTFEDAPWDSPYWAQHVIHVDEGDAYGVLHALGDYRIERFGKARQAIGDPTFALAAAAIERETNEGGSAPSGAWAR